MDPCYSKQKINSPLRNMSIESARRLRALLSVLSYRIVTRLLTITILIIKPFAHWFSSRNKPLVTHYRCRTYRCGCKYIGWHAAYSIRISRALHNEYQRTRQSMRSLGAPELIKQQLVCNPGLWTTYIRYGNSPVFMMRDILLYHARKTDANVQAFDRTLQP